MKLLNLLLMLLLFLNYVYLHDEEEYYLTEDDI